MKEKNEIEYPYTGIKDINGEDIYYGDEVEFIYQGSQSDHFGQPRLGLVIPEPNIRWEGGTIPMQSYSKGIVKVKKHICNE